MAAEPLAPTPATIVPPADGPADDLDDALAAARQRRQRGDRDIVGVDAVCVQWVVFAVGDQCFALPGARVAEILPLRPIHFVPGGPPALEGVIDVRGNLWSVLRLGDLVGSGHGAPTRHAAILLARAADMESGLRVDAVHDVLDLAPDAVLAPPGNLPAGLHGLVTGVFEHRGRQVLALDLARLFQVWRDGGQ